MSPISELFGTWHYPWTDEPTGRGWIHFDPSGFSIQFVFNREDPEKRIPMLLWYSAELPGVIRLRPKKQHQGWTIRYRFDEQQLILSDNQRTWACSKSEIAEIPEWFQESLSKTERRMKADLPNE
jgi:hypothetical protein